MRSLPLVAVGALLAAFAPTGAQKKAKTPADDEVRARIIPVLVLRPGESKEMLLSTSCTLVTRGAGLHFREHQDGKFHGADKEWKRDGVTAVFDASADDLYRTGKDQVPAVAERGIQMFLVKVTADADAKPGLIDLHVADSTCSGTCSTDLRVLVLARPVRGRR